MRVFINTPTLRVMSLLLILTSLAFAADHPAYVSRVWRTQDGLPESRIRAIAQTPDGYLWIGTPGGLARFASSSRDSALLRSTFASGR